MNKELRIALATVFIKTGAEGIEIHSGDREPGSYISREDILGKIKKKPK